MEGNSEYSLLVMVDQMILLVAAVDAALVGGGKYRTYYGLYSVAILFPFIVLSNGISTSSEQVQSTALKRFLFNVHPLI